MARALEEAEKLVTGRVGTFLVGLFGLAGIVVAAAIDPLAAGIASAAFAVALAAAFIYALRQRALYAGPYQILEETIVWRFPDPTGGQAFLNKQQRVRFNYLTIAHIELASGDGDLFASFNCNFGTLLERFPRSGEEGLLIVLKPERTRDEEADLVSEREIVGGFEGPDQWITFRFAAPSRKSELIVEFPDGHDVHDVRIEGPTGHGSRPAGDGEFRLEGARQVLRLKPRTYKANQLVRVTWSW